ncbi:MAG: hypothetical protein RL199_1414 [Pseudomonadota bacterium]|jgi:uncharacterized protein YegL
MSGGRSETSARAAEAAAVPEGLLEELGRLAAMAARRGDLVVVAGKPACGWSFRWSDGRIQVDPDDLAGRAPDLCRGLVVHEAAHAAVTRLEEVLSPVRLKALMPLLNVVEDCRIETWLRSQLPGSAPWIRAFNDVLFGEMRAAPVPRSRRAQMMRGLLETWWFGTTVPGLLPEVLAALRSTSGAVERAIDCQPPVGEATSRALFEAQQAMWRAVETGVLPAWERLEQQDIDEGLGELSQRELDQLLELLGSGFHLVPSQGGRDRGLLPGASGVTLRLEGGGGREATAGDRTPSDTAARALSASLHTDGTDAYLAAWRRVQPMADRVADEFLRRLEPNRRLRWSRGHPWGTRLDLRRAMQFSADPRRANDLWMRPLVPHRRDPAFLLLVDRSGSMAAHGRMEAAFDGLVLLVEALRRIGVPATVASFARDHRVDLGEADALDDAGRRKLGRLLGGCSGSTDLSAALRGARSRLAASAATPKLLFVLSDGQPDDADTARAAVAAMEGDGVHCVGLGLGPETRALGELFRTAAAGLTVQELPGRLAGLLHEALAA